MQLITVAKQQWHDYLYKHRRMPLWIIQDNTIWCDSEEYQIPLVIKNSTVTDPTSQATFNLSILGPEIAVNDHVDSIIVEDHNTSTYDSAVLQVRTEATTSVGRISHVDTMTMVDNIRQTIDTVALASERDLQALRGIIENINIRIHDIEEYLRRSDHADDRSSES